VHLKRPSVLVLAAIVTVLCAVGPVGARPARATSATVDIRDLAFAPIAVQVAVGDTVTWTNSEEIMPHDVTSGTPDGPDVGQRFGSDILLPGQAFAVTFSEAGEFTYLCKLHPTMTGVVIVAPQ
jgi:plastocyanin